jgi:predicted lipid-binding transport protein (Tim44 family)
MQKLMTIMFAVFLSFTVQMPEAEAGKRFGGGSSIGKSFSMPKKTTAPAATSSTTQQKAATPTTAPRKAGLGGMLGGLLAGGLLASLFMGGAFEGMQMMDFLLIGLLAFAAFKLFAMFRRQNAPAYAGAGGAPVGRYAEPAADAPMARTTSETQPDAAPGAGFGAALGATEIVTPQWFNRDAFVVGAQKHFSHLQKCWDEQNWEEIRSYVSPELFTELQAERGKQGAQHTEVVSVMAELASFIDNKDHVVASINFYGWLKEDSDQTTEFNEVWHLMRDMSVENADWVIVGIEQP